MTPEQLIAWHAHQITFLPATDNAVVQLHREAINCVVRLRTEIKQQEEALRRNAAIAQAVDDIPDGWTHKHLILSRADELLEGK